MMAAASSSSTASRQAPPAGLSGDDSVTNMLIHTLGLSPAVAARTKGTLARPSAGRLAPAGLDEVSSGPRTGGPGGRFLALGTAGGISGAHILRHAAPVVIASSHLSDTHSHTL